MHRIKPSRRRAKARTIEFDCGCRYRMDEENQVIAVNSDDCNVPDCVNAKIGQDLVEIQDE